MAGQRTINGANALIQITTAPNAEGNRETRVIGYATGISVTETYMLNRIDILGQMDSVDIEPIGRSVSGSISFMRMTNAANQDGEDLNLTGGGAGYTGLAPRTAESDYNVRTKSVVDFMNDGFDLAIIDSGTEAGLAPDNQANKVRYVIKGCRTSSQSFSLSRGSIMGVNVTFEALQLIEQDGN